MDTPMRTERDTFGPIEVPADRLWGAQTQRSLEHFAISGERMPAEFLHALALVKRAAAAVNRDLGLLDARIADIHEAIYVSGVVIDDAVAVSKDIHCLLLRARYMQIGRIQFLEDALCNPERRPSP